MSRPIMIFAAGFGTRMMPLTREQPKPLINVAGKPLIDHALALTRDLSPSVVVVNLHYKAKMLEQHLQRTDVETITEEPDILDTGGGLRNALNLLGTDPVMTLNSDAIWLGSNPLKALESAWRPSVMEGLLMTVRPEHALGYEGSGDFTRAPDGRITRGHGVVYGGAQIIKTNRLAAIAETRFSLNRVWDEMIAEKSLYSIEFEGKWCDVGQPGGIPLAEKLLGETNV